MDYSQTKGKKTQREQFQTRKQNGGGGGGEEEGEEVVLEMVIGCYILAETPEP